MRRYLLLLLLSSLCCLSSFGQENSRYVKGKVTNFRNDVSSVLIVNLNSEKSTITDSLGLFSIEVKLQDSLRITAVQYITKKLIITEDLLDKDIIVIKLVENIIDLSEVTVMPYNLTGDINRDIDRFHIKPTVTSYSLGLQNADVTKMTQSERLLLEADRGKYVKLATTDEYGKVFEILGYAALTVVVNTHKIMNRVSGRTKSLEEMVERDEKTQLEKDIVEKFSKKIMSDDFDIPEAHINGFLTYCISQDDFLELAEAGNSIEIWEYLQSKSIDFKKSNPLKE